MFDFMGFGQGFEGRQGGVAGGAVCGRVGEYGVGIAAGVWGWAGRVRLAGVGIAAAIMGVGGGYLLCKCCDKTLKSM